MQGNLIGTDASGTKALPNQQGVFINDSSSNVIGCVCCAANVISGNKSVGLQILGENAIDNVVLGNAIGTNLGHPRPAQSDR